MRKKNILLISITALISFFGCKRYDIKPISLPMYRQDYQVSGFDGRDASDNCFVTLDGHSVAMNDVGPQRDQYDITSVNFNKIDLGYSYSKLTTPGSHDAGDLFSSYYTSGNQDVNNWPIRNTGYFAVTTLSKSSFDTLTHIESVKALAQTADQTTVQPNAGQVIVFNLTRAYGLLYINTATSNAATFSAKYLLIPN